MSRVLAARLGYALRFARKDRVCEPALEHIASALKILKELPSSSAASGDGDPWWNGSDPWAKAATDGALGNDMAPAVARGALEGSEMKREQSTECVATDTQVHVSVKASAGFNPEAPAFTPFLQLPLFTPAVCNASESWQQHLHKLTDAVTALEKKVDSLGVHVSGFSLAAVEDVSASETYADTAKTFESKLLLFEREMREKMHDIEESVISEFRKYDEQLFLISEKLDGAEGLFREVHAMESRIMSYSDRWWRAEKINQEEIDTGLQAMKDLGAPEWAILDARIKHKQTAKAYNKMNSVAKEIDKLWRHVCPEGYGEDEADAG